MSQLTGLDLPAPVFGSEFSSSPPLLGVLSINLRNCDDFPASTFTLLPRLKVDSDLEGTVEPGEDGGRISFEGDKRRTPPAAEKEEVSSSAFLRLETTVVSFTP